MNCGVGILGSFLTSAHVVTVPRLGLVGDNHTCLFSFLDSGTLGVWKWEGS